MSDTDLIALYSTRLLGLAANIAHQGRLSAPQGVGHERSLTCGSNIRVELVLREGKIEAFAQEVQACVLGQAAAGVLAQSVIGCTKETLLRARQDLSAMLNGTGPIPAAPFADFEALLPAKAFKNRHASVLLALDATLSAFDAAQAAQSA